MKRILTLVAGILATASLFTSCLGTEEVELSGNAYIVSFSINDIKTEVPSKTSSGKDTTIVKTVTGSHYTFAIDHVKGEVYNVDSLPKGTDVTCVSVNMTVDAGYVYRYENEENKLFTTKDSVDFTYPVLFSLYSYDNLNSRSYYIRLNVHQTDVDSLVWTPMKNNNFHGGKMKAEKMVQLGNQLLIFGDRDGQPTMMSGQLSNNFSFASGECPLSGVAGKVDYSSIVAHENVVYLLADGKLYSSLTGVDWTEESPERTFTSMVGIVEGKLYLNANDTIVACDPYEWSADNYVECFTHDWEVVQVINDETFPVSPWVVSTPLTTNEQLIRTTLFGYPRNYSGKGVSIWSKISTEKHWTYYNPIEGNGQECPVLERLTVISYDGKLYAFGGAEKGGNVEAFEAIYTSEDGGITWWKQKSKIGFPEELKGYNDSFACAVDTNENIWIVCSNGLMFRGRIGG